MLMPLRLQVHTGEEMEAHPCFFNATPALNDTYSRTRSDDVIVDDGAS